MSTHVGAKLRRKLLLPDPNTISAEALGFQPWNGPEPMTEKVGREFLAGLESGLTAGHPVDTVRDLARSSARWRGFSFEGSGMGWALRDALTLGRASGFATLNLATSGRHTYLTTVGLGWALARLPRVLWPRLDRLDPAVAPLVLDGYGFHETFFHASTVLQARAVTFPTHLWPGPQDSVDDHLMRGVGRALWFVAGGDPRYIADTVATFASDRRPGLWAGVGLAATYAGGVSTQTLDVLAESAGEYLPWLRQGSAFAAEARNCSDTVVDHTHYAVRSICQRSFDDVVKIVHQARPVAERAELGDWGVYRQWTVAVAADLTTPAILAHPRSH